MSIRERLGKIYDWEVSFEFRDHIYYARPATFVLPVLIVALIFGIYEAID